MAKKRRRGFVAIPISFSRVLSSLANDAAESTAMLTFGEDIYLISMDISLVINGSAGEGPMLFALAHGDLSAAEALESLDAELSDPDDIIAKERARRPVRKLGMVPMSEAEQSLGHDGEIQRRSLRFSVGDAHSLNLVIVNRSGATISSSSVIDAQATLYGRWQR